MSTPSTNKLKRQSTSTFTFGLDKTSKVSNLVIKTKSVHEANGVAPHVSPSYGIEVYDKNIVDTPHSVVNYPLEVQLDFRKKMYSILCLELFSTFVFGISSYFIFGLFPLPQINNLKLLNKMLIGLSTLIPIFINLYCLYYFRQSFPANFIILALFSLIKGISIGFICSFTNIELLILFGVLFVLSVIMLLLSLIVFDQNTKFMRLMKVSNIGGIAWVLYAVVLLIVYNTLDFDTYNNLNYLFFRQFVIVTGVLMWFSYDANVLMKKLTIDEYMNGIVFLYTDMFVLMLLLMVVCIGLLGGDSNGNDLVNVGPEGINTNNEIIPIDTPKGDNKKKGFFSNA